MEVICKGDREENRDIIDIDQIETVFYILHKCQEELLDESIWGKSKNDFGMFFKWDLEKKRKKLIL